MGNNTKTPVEAIKQISRLLTADPIPPLSEIPGDGDGNGGYVCFSCERSLKKGESFVCVSRIWQTSEGGTVSVVDATSSLQVCIPCTLMASINKINWKSKPKIVDAEIHGFYAYARLLGYSLSRLKSDTRVDVEKVLFAREELLTTLGPQPLMPKDEYAGEIIHFRKDGQCHKCDGVINTFEPWMLIEIEINTSKHEGIHLSNIWKAAEFCHTCSRSLFPIDSNGRLNISV
jgi:hypothetical protein